MDDHKRGAQKVLIVEWAGATWSDLLHRLQSNQLPTLQRVAAAGLHTALTTSPAEPSLLGRSLELLTDAGVNIAAPTPATLPEEARVTPDELDPALLQQFPPDEEARPALTAALCDLYAVHNETVVQLSAAETQLAVSRHDFLQHIDAAFTRSPSLSVARRNAFQLLDLLLADLLHQTGGRIAVVICSAGSPSRSGFCLHAEHGKRAAELPRLPSPGMLPAFLASLLKLGVPPGSPLASPVPLTSAWLQPDVVRHEKYTSAREAAAAEEISLRETTPADQHPLTVTFPGIPWEAAAVCYVAVANKTPDLLAAAAAKDDGGLLFAARPNQSAASFLVLSQLLADARVQAMDRLFNTSEVPAGSPIANTLQEAGFVVSQTLDVWLTDVTAMSERVRAMTWQRDADWRVRPATTADVAFWGQRPEATSLVRPGTKFDSDLSFAIELGGLPAGLLLIERLAGRPAYVHALVVAPDARAAGGFALMLALSSSALQLAGVRQIVFTTDPTRREIIAFARRCGSRQLRQILRLQR